jgi:hypothetical protein
MSMWPYGSTNPMTSRFQSAKEQAANLTQPGERGAYTKEMFREDFPQFTKKVSSEEGKDPESQDLLPEGILNMFLTQANDSVLPSRWGSMWRYAAGLYLAHFSTMYLKTYAPASSGTAQVVAKAQPAGVIKSTTMGDTSVSYDNSAVTIGTEKWGSWNATQYGQQLVTLARLVGMGGMYVI